MTTHIIIGVVSIIIIVCLSLVSWLVLRKSGKRTDTLTGIMKSFSTISTDLKVITTKLETYDKNTVKSQDSNKEVIIASLKHLTDRIDKLEKTVQVQLSKMDSDLTKLYLHCSKKIERDL